MFPIRDVNPTAITPFITLALIAACAIVFFLVQNHPTQAETEEFLFRRAVISCEVTTGSPLTAEEIIQQTCVDDVGAPVFPEKNARLAALTSLFLHGGLGHLLFNMWFLWIFGNNVEEAYGHLGYLVMYVIGGLAATMTFVFMNPTSTVPLVGASGAIAAILGAYAILFPGHRVLTLVGWIPLPIPAALFLGIWFVLQFGLGGTNVAWEAHAGGFVFGAALTLFLRRRLLRRVLTPIY
jgi:membrane associated rhomboid family serine protease